MPETLNCCSNEQPKKIAQPSEIEDQLNRQDILLSNLSDIIKLLEDKISSVTWDLELPDEWQCEPKYMITCKLGETLYSNNFRIESRIQELKDLIERIRL